MWTCSASLCPGPSPEWVLEQVACKGMGREVEGRVLMENKEGLTVGRLRAWPQRVTYTYVTHC